MAHPADHPPALTEAHDRADELIMCGGCGCRLGELRHHRAVDQDALSVIGVAGPEERVRARWASEKFVRCPGASVRERLSAWKDPFERPAGLETLKEPRWVVQSGAGSP
jgi:hypothetical protein